MSESWENDPWSAGGTDPGDDDLALDDLEDADEDDEDDEEGWDEDDAA